MSTMYNSCYTCRRRRIECQMAQPPCTKCKKAGMECFQKRPLRWVQGAEFRGKAKKRASGGSSAKSMAESGSEMTPNTLVSTGVNGGTQTYLPTRPTEFAEGVPNAIPSIPSALSDPSSSGLNRVSQYYLYYCKYGHHNSLQIRLN